MPGSAFPSLVQPNKSLSFRACDHTCETGIMTPGAPGWSISSGPVDTAIHCQHWRGKPAGPHLKAESLSQEHLAKERAGGRAIFKGAVLCLPAKGKGTEVAEGSSQRWERKPLPDTAACAEREAKGKDLCSTRNNLEPHLCRSVHTEGLQRREPDQQL